MRKFCLTALCLLGLTATANAQIQDISYIVGMDGPARVGLSTPGMAWIEYAGLGEATGVQMYITFAQFADPGTGLIDTYLAYIGPTPINPTAYRPDPFGVGIWPLDPDQLPVYTKLFPKPHTHPMVTIFDPPEWLLMPPIMMTTAPPVVVIYPDGEWYDTISLKYGVYLLAPATQ